MPSFLIFICFRYCRCCFASTAIAFVVLAWTRWNHHVARTLREILEIAEESVIFSAPSFSGEALPNLEDIRQAFHMHGYAFSAPLVPIDPILRRVKLSGVWDFGVPAQQLSIAVRVQRYPCCVFAAWVYVVALIPK